MIKIEKTDIFGWESAIRGMRNPLNSWERIDTEFYETVPDGDDGYYHIKKESIELGKNDLNLMKRLAKAGNDHAKYLRMINVTCDITAPMYWWSEYDTYKVGTVANSCSKMHRIHSKRFEREDFSIEHIHNFEEQHWMVCMDNVISALNVARDKFNETKDKQYWWQMIQLLPASYNQKRTVQLNYQVLSNMYHSRKYHKLDEWREFCAWVETLPYFKEICLNDTDTKEI